MSVWQVLFHYFEDSFVVYGLVDELIGPSYESGFVLEALLCVGGTTDQVRLGITVRYEILVHVAHSAHKFWAVHVWHAVVSEDYLEELMISIMLPLN